MVICSGSPGELTYPPNLLNPAVSAGCMGGRGTAFSRGEEPLLEGCLEPWVSSPGLAPHLGGEGESAGIFL